MEGWVWEALFSYMKKQHRKGKSHASLNPKCLVFTILLKGGYLHAILILYFSSPKSYRICYITSVSGVEVSGQNHMLYMLMQFT